MHGHGSYKIQITQLNDKVSIFVNIAIIASFIIFPISTQFCGANSSPKYYRNFVTFKQFVLVVPEIKPGLL